MKNMLKSSILSSMDQKVVYFYLREGTVRFRQETAVHIGHHMSTKDKECTVNIGKIVFGDLLICSYLIMVISTLSFLNELFKQYCCSYYGSPLWPLQSDGVESISVAWRKAMRIICRVHPQTHCDVIASLSGQKPLILS